MNQKAAEELVAEIEAAWNSHDMARFAACFAKDADFVNVVGAWWRGRKEIEEEHAARHADRFKNSRIQVRLASFREIAPSIAVLHVPWRLDGHAESGPSVTADTRRGIWSWTVRQHDGQLEIVSSHNTDVLGALPASADLPPRSS